MNILSNQCLDVLFYFILFFDSLKYILINYFFVCLFSKFLSSALVNSFSILICDPNKKKISEIKNLQSTDNNF